MSKKKSIRYYVNSWKSNNLKLLVKEEIKREINTFLETNKNVNITKQNVYGAIKAVLKATAGN